MIPIKISDIGVLKMIDAIKTWQSDSKLHPLTCGKCHDHVSLKPEMLVTDSQTVNLSGQTGTDIILKCPICFSIQKHVPDCVYQWYIDTHMSHSIPLGQVVEVELDDGCGAEAIFYGKDYVFSREESKPSEGVEGDQEIVLRFIGTIKGLVVGHTRDCDGTPLYYLSNIRVKYVCDELPECVRSRLSETFLYKKWSEFLKGGYSQDSLKVIEGQFVPLLHNSIFEFEASMKFG